MNIRFRQVHSSKMGVALNHVATVHRQASSTYSSLGIYFQCQDVALGDVSAFFRELAEEKREAARYFLKQSRLGCDCPLTQGPPGPSSGEWCSCLHAMEVALELEKSLHQALLELHSLASAKEETNLLAFLEDYFLEKEEERLKQMSDYLTNLRRLVHPPVKAKLGEFLFKKASHKPKCD
ncbi:ferritin light chain-like [Sorex araneus]|uniref:ferritin light chain-like n=1 Tax=Sorex araneus TaxID=42254 RepID=UPI0024339406|nr:ferritin light chain-like [Sorex araneus]